MKGTPIYKKSSFKNISKILGPQYKWIDKTPEEYFGDNLKLEALAAIKILNFSGKESLPTIRNKYITLSKIFHPDSGGHPSAFDILNKAFCIFKAAH